MHVRPIALCAALVALACGGDSPEPPPEPEPSPPDLAVTPAASPGRGAACVAEACDDQDVCTADGCGATGCVHTDLSSRCPAPDDPCMAAVCDPARGCAEVKLGDGAPCGLADGCLPMQCQGGRCVLARGAPTDCPQ